MYFRMASGSLKATKKGSHLTTTDFARFKSYFRLVLQKNIFCRNVNMLPTFSNTVKHTVSFTDLVQGREILSRFSLPKSMKHSVAITLCNLFYINGFLCFWSYKFHKLRTQYHIVLFRQQVGALVKDTALRHRNGRSVEVIQGFQFQKRRLFNKA